MGVFVCFTRTGLLDLQIKTERTLGSEDGKRKFAVGHPWSLYPHWKNFIQTWRWLCHTIRRHYLGHYCSGSSELVMGLFLPIRKALKQKFSPKGAGVAQLCYRTRGRQESPSRLSVLSRGASQS